MPVDVGENESGSGSVVVVDVSEEQERGRFAAMLARPSVALRVIRYVGLLGSTALAVDAYLAGALPALPVQVTPQIVATGPGGVLIMLCWLLGTAALAGSWWFGRHLIGAGVITPRWVVVTAVLWMLPMLMIPPIASRDVYAYSCQGALYAAGHDPYHEGISALPCPWLGSVSLIWRSTPTPYGPLFIMLAGLAARLGSLAAAIAAFRVIAVAGVALLVASLPPAARRLGLPVDRTLWLVLASPLVAIHFLGGAHNDALTLGFLAAAIALIVTRYDRVSWLALGGVLLGLTMSVKPTMLVVVPFVVLYAAGGADSPPGAAPPDAPPKGRGPFGFPPIKPLVNRGGAVLAGALVGLGVPTLVSGLGFGWVYALLHADGGTSWTSVSTAIGTTINWFSRSIGLPVQVVPAVRAIGVYLLVAALVLIFWRARHGNRLYAAGLALLSITFFAPFAEPWYLMWPLVMFALTPVRARWFAVVVVASCFTAMPDGVGLDALGRLGLSAAMAVLGIWALVVGIRWLRGAQPAEVGLAQPPAVSRHEAAKV